jgi:hypothetical protein
MPWLALATIGGCLAFGVTSAQSIQVCNDAGDCFDFQPLSPIVCTLPAEPLPPDPPFCPGGLATQPPVAVVPGNGIAQSGHLLRAKAKVRLALQGKRDGKRWATLVGPVKTRSKFNFVWRTPANASGVYQLRLAVLRRSGGVRFASRAIARVRVQKR